MSDRTWERYHVVIGTQERNSLSSSCKKKSKLSCLQLLASLPHTPNLYFPHWLVPIYILKEDTAQQQQWQIEIFQKHQWRHTPLWDEQVVERKQREQMWVFLKFEACGRTVEVVKDLWGRNIMCTVDSWAWRKSKLPRSCHIHCQGASDLVTISTVCLHRWKWWGTPSPSCRSYSKDWYTCFHWIQYCCFLFNTCMLWSWV